MNTRVGGVRRLYVAARTGVDQWRLRYLYAARGEGWVFNGPEWDRQYRIGAWEFLENDEERGRFAAIAQLIRLFPHAPSVLDLGCGAGRLAALLEDVPYARYVGIDISAEAIGRARSRGLARAQFQVASFDNWAPGEPFDCVVFNETLYYARRPLDALTAYARRLTADGRLIVSMFRDALHLRMWRDVERCFAIERELPVVAASGATWDVKLMRPLGRDTTSGTRRESIGS